MSYEKYLDDKTTKRAKERQSHYKAITRLSSVIKTLGLALLCDQQYQNNKPSILHIYMNVLKARVMMLLCVMRDNTDTETTPIIIAKFGGCFSSLLIK